MCVAVSCVVLQDRTLLAIGPLDRESRETYDLTVTALDKGNPPREVTTENAYRP